MTNDSKTTDAANDETPRVCPWCDKPLRADETEQCAICGESMCEDCAYKCDRCDDIMRESARSAYAAPRTTPAMRLATSRKED